MSVVAGKRKRSVLTLEKKLELVKKLEKGLSQLVVGEKFGVAKSTVVDIWKDHRKLSDAISSSEPPAFSYKKRCIVRPPKFQLVDESCWKWFCQQWLQVVLPAVVTSVPQFLVYYMKKKLIFSKLYPDENPEIFKTDTGRLTKFYLRCGIKNAQLRGEILSCDPSAIEPFFSLFKHIYERFSVTGISEIKAGSGPKVPG